MGEFGSGRRNIGEMAYEGAGPLMLFQVDVTILNTRVEEM